MLFNPLILQKGNLRPRERKRLVQGHSEQQPWVRSQLTRVLSRVPSCIQTHLLPLNGQAPSDEASGTGCGRPRLVPWACLLDSRHPRSAFLSSLIRGRECRSWCCQGESCEVAKTQFGSSQVAEEGFAEPGVKMRTCRQDRRLTGAWRRTSNSAG